MGPLGAVDNHGISWQKSHKKPNKMRFCRDSVVSPAGHQSNLLRFCRDSERWLDGILACLFLAKIGAQSVGGFP